MEFHPEKEIPILKGIAQHSATKCKVNIDYNKTSLNSRLTVSDHFVLSIFIFV